VYYKVGLFDDDREPRFIEAPFDVVKIDGKIYLQPKSHRLETASLAQGVTADLEQARFKRQMFYTELKPLVVEEHQMNSIHDDKTWMGMHFFGWA